MLGSVLSLTVVGGGGRQWEFLGDSGRLEGGDRGRVGRGRREGTGSLGRWAERVTVRINIFQTFSCSLSFGLGYGQP